MKTVQVLTTNISTAEFSFVSMMLMFHHTTVNKTLQLLFGCRKSLFSTRSLKCQLIYLTCSKKMEKRDGGLQNVQSDLSKKERNSFDVILNNKPLSI